MPTTKWKSIFNEFVEVAKASAENDPPDAIVFAAVLSEQSEHEMEAEILGNASDAAKGHSMYDGLSKLLETLKSRALAAKGNRDSA